MFFKTAFQNVAFLMALWVIMLREADSLNTSLYRAPRASCYHGYFICNDSSNCVEQRLNCNGVKDCDDGSDEWNCNDKALDRLFNKMFIKRQDEDREKKYRECELSWIPQPCSCSLKSLFCENSNLTTIPNNVPDNITEWDLSGNLLPSVDYTQFPKLENLTKLIFNKARVSSLGINVFQRLGSLKELYMAGNLLKTLGNLTFYSNTALKRLIISYNPLQQISIDAFKGLDNLNELDLRNCSLESLSPQIFIHLGSLKLLWLQENRLVHLPEGVFQYLKNLEILSLDGNQLISVDDRTLKGLAKIELLSLASNLLTFLKSKHFGNTSSLLNFWKMCAKPFLDLVFKIPITVLFRDLQDNDICRMESDAFHLLPNLQSLNLKGNALKKVHSSTFTPLKSLQHIYFSDFFMCSHAQHVRVCEPKGDGISSISHLLDNLILRISVWIVAFLACLGNACVLLGRLLVKETNEVHSFYIKNLSVADFLMGLYLFIIAGHDVAFRGEYIRNDLMWRSSWQCNLAGILSTVSSEGSVFILTIITADRYISIMYPLFVRRRTFKFAYCCTFFSWLCAVIIAILPVCNLGYYGSEFYGNNGVCLALQIHDPFSSGWQYSLFVFCGINSLAFLFITFAYIRMFITISSSKLGLRCSQQRQDRTIAKRFAFIVGTDLMCWVPIIMIKFLAVGGLDIDADLYAWVAVFLLPINSALNPLLYTLTTKLFKQQLAKIVYTWRVNSLPAVAPGDCSEISMSSVLYNVKVSKHSSSSNSDLDRSVSRASLLSANSRSSGRYNWGSPSTYIVYQNNYF